MANVYNRCCMITSTQNELIKQLLELKNQKNILCLDNPKLIEEAKLSGNNVLYVLTNSSQANDGEIQVSDNVLKKFSNTITSQGVVALIECKPKEPKPPNGNFLILDNVQDPGNVGTLIRSAVGADFLDIYLINCARVYSDKVVRSTMGAIFKCNVYEVDNEFVSELKNWNKTILIADMNGENIYDCKFDKNVGVVVGNEGHGVSKNLREIATNKVSIPMHNALESLNAGVSGSIIMYQITYGGNK